MPEPQHEHTGENCDRCAATNRVAAAGARTLCEHAGIDYEALTNHQRAHYAVIASEVMAAMSSALIDTGLLREADHG